MKKLPDFAGKGDKKCTDIPVRQAIKTIINCQILPENEGRKHQQLIV